MSTELAPGSVFAKRYRVERRIGSGGFGTVYAATHEVTGRHCALKVLFPHLAKDEPFRQGFLRESRVTSAIVSENIVDVLDAGIDEETNAPFIVMELLEGEVISERIKRKQRFSIAETIVYLTQLAVALEVTHKQSVIHRDLKPENLFLTRRADGGPLIKVLDFGIAKVIAEHTVKGMTQSAGTPMYMAPEQFRGETLTQRVDVYALGMLAFLFLAGKHYFRHDRSQCKNPLDMAMILVEGPKEAASMRAARYQAAIPQAFDAWFVKATHPDPQQRLPGAAQAVIELCQCLGQEVPAELRRDRVAPQVGALTAVVGPEANPVLSMRNPQASYPEHSSPYSAPSSEPVSPRSGSDVAIVAGAVPAPAPARSRGLVLALGAVALGGAVLLVVLTAVFWSRSVASPASAAEEAPATKPDDIVAAPNPAPSATPSAVDTEPAPETSDSVEQPAAPTAEAPKPEPAPAPEKPSSAPEKPSSAKPSTKPEEPTAKPQASGKPVETPDKLYSRE